MEAEKLTPGAVVEHKGETFTVVAVFGANATCKKAGESGTYLLPVAALKIQ